MGIMLCRENDYSNYAGMQFDLAAGCLVTGLPSNGGAYSVASWKMVKLPNNYWSIEQEMYLTATSTHMPRISFIDQAHLVSGGIWTGDGVSELHFWGAELSPLF
jgi:hypothetical protein